MTDARDTSARVGTARVRRLKQALRSVGLRSTTARLAVLDYFHSRAGAHAHAEVVEALARRAFDRATVYRVLLVLSDAKLLRGTIHADRIRRFELAHPDETSAARDAELVCSSCGATSTLVGARLLLEDEAAAPRALLRREYALRVVIRCDACG